MKILYLAGGCFWGVEKFFQQFPGVVDTEVGYANGPAEGSAHGGTVPPSYEEVCRGSGHAETVKVIYDEAQLSTRALLDYYFMAIDPLSLYRQGPDVGIQYRTGIYYEDESLLPKIREVCSEKEAALGQKLAVEVKPLENFAPAEAYHQDYLNKNPGGYCHIPPRLFALGQEEP